MLSGPLTHTLMYTQRPLYKFSSCYKFHLWPCKHLKWSFHGKMSSRPLPGNQTKTGRAAWPAEWQNSVTTTLQMHGQTQTRGCRFVRSLWFFKIWTHISWLLCFIFTWKLLSRTTVYFYLFSGGYWTGVLFMDSSVIVHDEGGMGISCSFLVRDSYALVQIRNKKLYLCGCNPIIWQF